MNRMEANAEDKKYLKNGAGIKKKLRESKIKCKELFYCSKTGIILLDGAFYMVCVQRSWTTLAGVSPVTVIASEPCS